MESDEQPRSVSAGPLPQDSPPQKEGARARRRSIRGRRSEIRVEVVGASPMVIPAPLSDSLAENSVSDLEAELTQRRNHIVAYVAQLRSEKEQWEERLERHSTMAKRAARIVDRSHERKPAARIPIEELGQVNTTQKPQYTLHRVMRKFNSQNTDLQLQKTVDELTAEQDAVAESISAQKRRAEQLAALLSAESNEELLARRKWWEMLKEKAARRVRRLEEKYARMGISLDSSSREAQRC